MHLNLALSSFIFSDKPFCNYLLVAYYLDTGVWLNLSDCHFKLRFWWISHNSTTIYTNLLGLWFWTGKCLLGILANIPMFKANSRNTRKRCEICSKLERRRYNTRTTSMLSVWWFYCYLWTYFTPFSSASIVDFE